MVNFWGETEFDDGHQWYSILRGIFETALISLVAVFLLQHDSHESHLATVLSMIMAATGGASLLFSIIEFFALSIPCDDPGVVPVILHLFFAGARLAILILGLVPRNTLRLIWVKYKRDDHGGVIISMLAILWAIDMGYILLAMETSFKILTCPCWSCWECFYGMPVRSLKRRGKKNQEIAGYRPKADVEANDKRGVVKKKP